jgi:hypothetical protein
MKKYLSFLIFVIVLISWSGQDRNWRQLLNGKDLTGWEQVGPGKFVVENGLLKTVGGMGMILYPAEKFSDVIIRVVYMVKDNDCNSGVFIRIPEKPSDEWVAVNTGYEVQIDNGTRHVGGDYHCSGVLYSLTKALAHPQKKPGEWNTMEITWTIFVIFSLSGTTSLFKTWHEPGTIFYRIFSSISSVLSMSRLAR